jgi:ABC-2 type transport system permease protein
MRKALKVARREYLAQVRTKGFVIGLLVAPVFMGGSAIAMLISENRVDVRERQVVVIDHAGEAAEVLIEAARQRNETQIFDADSGKQVRPAYTFEITAPREDLDSQRLELSDRVRRRELQAFMEIGPAVLHPRAAPGEAFIRYFGQNASTDPVREWAQSVLNDHLRRLRMVDAGLDLIEHPDVLDYLGAEPMGLVRLEAGTGDISTAERTDEIRSIIVPMIMMMLLFLMMMWGAMPQLNAVMEEKSQRIAEVILGSIRPFDFMLGKLIGGVGVSMTVALVYLVGGVFTLQRLGMGGGIPYHVLPWWFAFMILAILMFGAILAALGAACNDVTEAQAVQFPAMIPFMVPMFIMLPVLTDPAGGFATGISLFPLFTPLLMVLRMSSPAGVPIWQAWVGLVATLLTAVLLIWAGGRVFRVAILSQGTPPKLKNLVRWAIRG